MPGSRSTLFPGYREVESFGSDEEYEQKDGEVDEEVTYVTLDLGTVEPTLVPNSSSYRLIGLDTLTPFLQLSGTVFKGQHQTLLGTELLFTDAKEDNNDRNKKSFIPIATTEQRIRFREVELKPKADHSKNPKKSGEPSKSSKKRGPQTLSEVVGSDDIQIEDGSHKRPVRSRAKGKGRGKKVKQSEGSNSQASGGTHFIPADLDGKDEQTQRTIDTVEGSSASTSGGVLAAHASEAMDIDVETAQG